MLRESQFHVNGIEAFLFSDLICFKTQHYKIRV